MVSLLLERGADVMAIDPEEGTTALHIAASEGMDDVASVLIKGGRKRSAWLLLTRACVGRLLLSTLK